MGHALCLSAEQTSWPLYERRYPGLFLREVTRFLSQGRHCGYCLSEDDRSLSEGRWPGLCHRGDPQVSVWKYALPLSRGEPQSLYDRSLLGICLRGDTLVPFWEETPCSISEKRHPDLCHRGDTLNTGWGGGHAGLWLRGSILNFLWKKLSWSFSGVPWSLSRGRCSGLCLKGKP